jgi:hypothetical protein
VPDNHPPYSKLRAYAFSFGLLIFGLVIAIEGWRGWSESSVMVYLKGRSPFVASPATDTELWFYVFTIGFIAAGFLSCVLAAWLVWLIAFSSSTKKHRVITELSFPLGTRYSPKIPTWSFWLVIASMISGLIFAAIKHT